jgi:hypothetical protein
VSDATDSLIIALSGQVRTREDNTLRLQLAVSKELAKAAFRLFGQRGTRLGMTVLGKPELGAVEGASAVVETMAKGVLRLYVDIEPRDAARAFELFGEQDTLMALAAIKPEHLRQREAEQQQRLEARGMRPAYLAVQWCSDLDFQQWLWSAPELNDSRDAARAFAIQGGQPTVPLDKFTAMVMCHACGITSRRELDTDADARSRFDRNIRRPFIAWQQANTPDA